METTASYIPDHLLTDRYWKGLLYLFSNNSKLQRYMTREFLDLEECTVHAAKLLRVSAPWSNSEKFMLRLALHLFNERNKVNLSDMDYLDPENKQMAYKAIQLRFGA
jgi:hypothetical protein